MDEILPLLEEDNNSWGSQNIYCYWFQRSEGRFYVIFELAGVNVPKSTMENMQKIIDIMKSNHKRRDEFTFKRIYRTKWFDAN
jgi:hypothetical protein